jgi:alkylresorcinol/alkylpyrone synthase
MRIASVASSLPKHYYSQSVLARAFQRYWALQLEDSRKVELLHSRVGVDGRYLVLPMDRYERLSGWGEANNAWIEAAQELGEQAIGCALARAGLERERLGAFFFVSVTGIASPSIDARLINRMGLPRNIRRVPIFGLGCVAGAAGISRAADWVRAYPGQAAVLLSVELCSLTLQRNDLSMANVISAGLFGDGAAAVVVAGADCGLPGPEILDTRSVFYPDTEEVMGWEISENGFKIVLSKEVPEMVHKHLAGDVEQFLTDHGLTRDDIGSWILHTGGPAILEATQTVMGFRNGELAASWDCLRRTGNLSSASVLMVLEEVMTKRRPAAGTLSVMAAMGPGFCSELILLRW